MRFGTDSVIGVVGAGAMGAGIAQVAAAAGHRVVLADAFSASLARARSGHAKAMQRDVEKGRRSAEESEALLGRITYVEGADDASLVPFSTCALVIEAIVEELAVKQSLFATLERVVRGDTVLASNTSSLAIAAIAGACQHSGRVLGVHFFNPAPVMPLVEIIPALTTDASLAADVRTLVDGWGKVTVMASDTPGFIVNRIARPFYGEALRIREEQIADCATIDWAMRELGGFRMGPFELMDFIGNDVNYAVTCSVFEAMSYDPRYKPALTQRRLVEARWLGRKTGRGYYDYREGASAPEAVQDVALGRQIVDRMLAMLVNEAADALHYGVASVQDIELAMTKGVNYPRGLLEWGDAIGPSHVLVTLERLQAEYAEDRYRPSVRLRRVAESGGSLRA